MITNVAQMYDSLLEPVRGWFHEQALECTAPMSANVTFDVSQGRVVHVNSSKEFEMGVSGGQVGIFLMKDALDADVAQYGDATHGIYTSGGSVMTGLVCTGGFEVSTTEYDSNQSYAPNDPLTATASNSSSSTGGVLTNSGVTRGSTCICGIVAKDAVKANKHGTNALHIWTYYLPTIP